MIYAHCHWSLHANSNSCVLSEILDQDLLECLPQGCNIGAFRAKSARENTKILRKHLEKESAFDILFNIGPHFLVILG